MRKYRRCFSVPAPALLAALFLLGGCAGQETVQAPEQAAASDLPEAPVETPARVAPEMEAPERAAPQAAAARDTVSLWKVTAGGNTVCLLGSLHLLTPEDYPLDGRYYRAYESAGTVVLETDLDVAETPEFMTSLLAQAVYADGRTLKSDLPADLYTELAAVLAGMNMDLEQFKLFKPWFVSMTLSALHILQMGYDPALGVDRHFHERARADGKTVEALESPGYQIGLLASFSDLDQQALLHETLLELEQLDAIVADIHAAWRSGDLEAIDLLNQSMRQFPSIYNTLVSDRNSAWVERIAEYLQQDEDVLVVVGVGHMAGSDGLIELLRARGLRVDRY